MSDIDHDVVRDGERAARILEDPVFQSAVQMVDDQIIEEWRAAESVEERELAHSLQLALAEVIRRLEVIVGRGEMEKSRR